jgi:hypothetical protein
MASLTRTALLLSAALSASAAAAQSGVPTLNLTATCRALDRNDFSIQIDTQRCLKTENEARAKLAGDWSKYSAADRNLCTQTAKMGGIESYVHLLTCIELRQHAATGPTQRDPAVTANRPTTGPTRTRPTGLSQ